MNFKMIAAAAALAVTGVANAAVDNFASGNSSIGFIAYDNAGTSVGSVFVDLGASVNDFFPQVTGNFPDTPLSFMEASNTNLAASNTTAVWNFGNNTLTVNGAARDLGTTNDWSAFSTFLSSIDATTFKWGVIGGDSGITNGQGAQRYLTTGTPNAAALSSQNGSATSGMGLVETLMTAVNGVAVEGNDSYYTNSATSLAYVGNSASFGAGKWQNKTKWDTVVTATTAGGVTQTNFWALSGTGQEFQVGNNSGAANAALLNNKGTWSLDVSAKTLTWSTPIPEPESYALVVAGLAVVAAAARRRAAK